MTHQSAKYSMSLIYKIFFSSFFLIAFLAGNLFLTTKTIYAASLTVRWNANPEGDISGYRLYYGTASYTYGPPVDVGNVTGYTLPNLAEGTTYYLSLSALDTSHNESDTCNEISAVAYSVTCPWDPSHPDYCRDCGPCPEGRGDCDNDSECRNGLVCAQDVGADYGWDPSIDVCECPWDPGHFDYCLDCGPCPEGMGDCDNDSDCQNGLVCVQDVGADYGWDPSIDVCEYSTACPWDPGHPDYCLDCGPCPEGMGDCDKDSECQDGLVCAQDVGADYGWDPSIDVCECPWNPGHPDYCRDCGPCPEGSGDCDNDSDCRNGLVCVQDVGTDYGWDPGIDVCGYPWNPVITNECPLNPGHPDYCLDCGPCPEGSGDCDNDSDCQTGLVCAQDVGTDYGWDPSIDVCECPWNPGHPDYCLDCGPCPEGRGDCDNDDDCQSGLVCIQDVGADYGWNSLIDVCEMP